MKNQVLRGMVVLGLGILLAAPSALAQLLSTTELVADIPFSFIVSDRTLPAGKYTVGRFGVAANHLLLKDSDRITRQAVSTRPLESLEVREEGSLIFNRYGNLYFLSQVWQPTLGTRTRGVELEKTQAEMSTATRMVAHGAVEVAAVRH